MKRILYFDILRILSCLMIVLMHSPMPGLGTPGYMASGISYLTAPGIGLFYMISGALVLGRYINNDDSQYLCTMSFLKHRLIKVGIPLIFWYSFYSIMSSYGIATSGVGVMWFMWSIMGLYVLSPILVRWIQRATNTELYLYIGIWIMSLLYTWIKEFTPINESDSSFIYYFHGYVGYFVLGAVLYKKRIEGNKKYMHLLYICFFLISICLPVIVLLLGVKVNFYNVFWYLSPSIVLMCTILFLLAKRINCKLDKIPRKCKNVIIWVSNNTFGIYLVHIFIMSGLLKQTEWMQNMNGILQIVVCWLLTLLISIVVTTIIRKIPYIRAIVG